MAKKPKIIDYKGLLITSPEPSEEGGQLIITDFKLVADRLEVVDQKVATLETITEVLSGNFDNVVNLTDEQTIVGEKTFIDLKLSGIIDQHVLIVDSSGQVIDSGYTISDIIGVGSGDLNTINLVPGDDTGNINFTSPDNSLTITPISGSNEVQITLYTAITGSINNDIGTVEIGSSVASVTFNWSYNNGDADPESQLIKRGTLTIAIPPVGNRSVVYNPGSALTSNTTFTLEATDGITNITPTTSVLFRNKRYWGVTASRPMPDNDILTMNDGEEFSTSRSKTITYDASGGAYFWFAYPTSFGLASVKANGLAFSSWYDGIGESTSPQTRSFTNASGHTEDYYVYVSYNLQNGSAIEVQFS